nr:hypothetical protein [Neorhizobium tomejilense]
MFDDIAKKTRYMVYTKKYDVECGIGDLVSAETIGRLATHHDFYGYEDTEAVEAAIAPISKLDTGDNLLVTFLVDMSGSVKGRPVNAVCQAVLAGALALEDLGATTSVLGYTTGKKNRPADEFNADKSIRYPGRLSEAVFVTAKPFGRSAAESVGQILALGTEGLNYENLDGEALVWAAEKMLERQAAQRILVLVTDGFEPHCAKSEQFAERRDFMVDHLRAVAERLGESELIDFTPVVMQTEYFFGKQTTYRNPVQADPTAEDITRAIVEALGQNLRPKASPEPALQM